MFVGCFEITISVNVTHVQHIVIVRALCLSGGDLLRFSVPVGDKKNCQVVVC